MFHLSRHFNRRMSVSSLSALALMALLTLASPSTAPAASMSVVVDATELPRKLLHSTANMDLADKTRALLYPKWIPGIHGPRGPVENVSGLRILDASGKTLDWKRDWSDVYRFFVEAGARKSIEVSLDYICSQPSVNSRGIDSYGEENIGIINWNTVLLYPQGIPVADINVSLTLVLPQGWGHGSALRESQRRGDTVEFETVTFEELIDAPLICGENFRKMKLVTTERATYYLHLASDDAGDLPRHDSIVAPLAKLAREAEALFGGVHFAEYDFLLTLSDRAPRLGLEHRSSSLNGVRTKELRDAEWKNKRIPYLLPHEFAHAWCGKYRRPAGMHTPDYMADKDTDLLWVYEGMTQYLGYALKVRSGLQKAEDFIGDVAGEIGGLINQKGRRWRPLRDTEVAAYTLRGGSKHWGYLRRSQDYYREGAMLWLEIDARLRNMTDGETSIEDFCHDFFTRGDGKAHALPFDLDEIIGVLNRHSDFNWDSLITQRVYKTQERFDPEVARQCGYRLEYTTETPERVKRWQKRFKGAFFYESIGLSSSSKGKISDVIPGSPADQSGLFSGVQIVGVEGKKFSVKRLEDAIRNSVMTEKVTLLVLNGDSYEDVVIEYS
ncbi:MAG: hypothetical protein ACE5GA_01120, partial [Candidatus Zixiibacteriota bacterium]